MGPPFTFTWDRQGPPTLGSCQFHLGLWLAAVGCTLDTEPCCSLGLRVLQKTA